MIYFSFHAITLGLILFFFFSISIYYYFLSNTNNLNLLRLVWVLWHINNCRLFNAKSCLYIRLLRSSESSLPCGAMLELSVTSMRECESYTTNLNTPAPYAHMGLVTLMSHMTFSRETDK